MSIPEILYQFAPGIVWPTVDATWSSDRAVDMLAASQGSALIAGEAQGRNRFGQVKTPTASAPSANPLPTSHPSLGRYARLLRQDAGGTVSLFSTTWTPFWWGFCARINTRYLGTDGISPVAGMADYFLRGLSALLEQVMVIDGYEGNASAAHPWNIYHAPDFNAKGLGNRTSSTWSINARSVYVFDHFNLGSAQSWTVAQAIDYLLEAFTLAHGGGSTWTIQDDSTLGAQVLPPTAVHGRTLLQAISELANPSRGLTWEITVGAGNRPILILSDWKPSTGGVALDASGRDWTAEIIEDTCTAVDHAMMLTQRPPMTTLTVNYKTTGSPLLAADGWTFGAPPSNDPTNLILRRFKIASAVLDQMRVELVHTSAGYDGSRQNAAAVGGGPSSRGAELERMTGMAHDQKTASVATLTDPEQRSPARVFVRGTGSTSWEDWSDKVSVSISRNPVRLLLNINDDQVLDLYTVLNAGGELRITIGVREHAEYRKSSRVADAYRGTREVARTVGDVDQQVVTSGSAIAMSSGNLVTASADVTTWDSASAAVSLELDRLKSSMLRSRQVDVTISKRSLDFTTLPPRTLVSSIDGGPGPVSVDACITRRNWDFMARKTSWTNKRASDGVE